MKYCIQELQSSFNVKDIENIYGAGDYFDISKEDGLMYSYICSIIGQHPKFYMKIQTDTGFWFPCMDFDHVPAEKLYASVKRHLTFPYIIIESRGKNVRMEGLHFWVIVDNPLLDFDKVIKFIGGICPPYNDWKYYNCAITTKNLVLRAFPKNGKNPLIVHKSADKFSHLFTKWINEFEEHWKHPLIDDMISLQFSKML